MARMRTRAAAFLAGVSTACFAPGLLAPQHSGIAEASEEEPVLGSSERLTLRAGEIAVRVRGTASFVALSGSVIVPDGSEVEARRGRVEVTVAGPSPGSTIGALVYQGRFLIHQDLAPPELTQFMLSEHLAGCEARARPGRHTSVAASRRRRTARPRARHLWVSDHGGNWGTGGRYVSTSVQGTNWLTTDECRRSAVKVASGVVTVRDLIHRTTVTVTAGHSYIAAKPVPEARGFVPLPGNVLAGESGGEPAAFSRQVGKHVAVFGYFANWGWPVGGLAHYVESLHARLLVHLSTDEGYGASAGQTVSPRAIARGTSDSYLLSLGRELSKSRVPVYLALLPEMNQANNAYSAFNANGSSRGPANSTASYRQAWRRTALILRGGSVSRIDRRLRALGMPPLADAVGGSLPEPKLSLMWAPQTAGTPDTRANAPAAYYPGAEYVDIVGTDFYSAFPNFAGLLRLYNSYRSKPFGFNEWAMWKNGDPGFVRQLFAFVRTHRRVALMVYNDGLTSNGPFRLDKFPAARRAIARELRSGRFLPYPPGAEPPES